MGNYDAEVRISTKIDTSQMQQLKIQMDRTIIKAERLQSELEGLKNKKIPTQEYTKLQKELSLCQKELNKLIAKESQMEQSGMTFGRKWENIISKEAEAGIRMDEIKEKMQQLETSGKAFTIGADPEEIRKKAQELSLVKAELGRIITKQEELSKKNHTLSGGFSRLKDAAKKAFLGLNKHAQKTNGLFSTLAGRLKGIALSLLIFNWISKGFNGMIAGMKEGSRNLIKYSAEYNSSMSALKSANTQLKNSFATAFLPIAQAAIPHLISLINCVTLAMNKVAQFTAVLSGKSTWIKATAVQEDYAASLNGTAAAAKKAVGALASFDSLEVLEKKEESSAGGGSGLNPDDMFEEVPIEDTGVFNFAKRLKELILEDDWYGVGAAIGDKINDAMKSIKWDDIKEKARNIAKNIANFLNGGLETVEWKLLGGTIADGLNTGLEFAYTFATTFHWDSLGLAISDSINGFFETFDFQLAAETLNEWADGLKETIKTAINNTHWDDVWEGIKTFLNSLEIDTISVIIGAILWKSGGAKLTGELLKTVLASAVGWAVSSGALTWTVEVALVVSLASVVFDNIKNPAIELFSAGNDQLAKDMKERYKDAGASLKVLDDAGKMATGKLKGLPIVLRDGSYAAGTMAEALENIAGGAIYTTEELQDMQELVGLTGEDIEMLRDEMLATNPELMEIAETFGLWDASIETLKNIASGMDALQRSAGNLSPTLELMQSPMSQMTDEARAFFKEVADGNIAIDDYISTMGEASAETQSFFSGSSEKWKELVQGINDGISKKWGEFCEWWTETAVYEWFDESVTPWFSMEKWMELAQGIYDGISEKWGQLVSWWESTIGDWWDNNVAPWFTAERWKTLGDNMKKGIFNGFVGIANKVVDVVNAIISACENMINYMINKINKLIESCAELVNGIPGVDISVNGIPNMKFDRVKYPSIPALADGAVIRGGNPFMAILGDQRMGQTNIEAPQSAIEDAVLAGMNRAGMLNGGNMTININYDGETFARLAVKDFLSEMDRQGYNIDLLGGLT